MNLKVFFRDVRPLFGGSLTEDQVAGMEKIISVWMRVGNGNVNKLAYALATTKWETAHTMQPIHERGPITYFRKYDPGTAIGKRLGNTLKGDGYRFRGRGYVQLTGRRNYRYAGDKIGVDLVSNPEAALDPEIAAVILIRGMMEGWFTGKGMNNYIDDVDEGDEEDLREFVAARRTVNGTDKATEIGKMALAFERAIREALVAHTEPIPVPAKKNWLSLLIEFLLSLFRKKP